MSQGYSEVKEILGLSCCKKAQPVAAMMIWFPASVHGVLVPRVSRADSPGRQFQAHYVVLRIVRGLVEFIELMYLREGTIGLALVRLHRPVGFSPRIRSWTTSGSSSLLSDSGGSMVVPTLAISSALILVEYIVALRRKLS